jgi:hypothetical protein
MNMPADQYDLYAEFGMAAEKAQVLELDAGNIALLYAALVVKNEKISGEQRGMLRDILDDCDRSTLGKLLRQVKSIGEFDESILRAVDEALERRNYLTHKFFRTHNFAILGEAGRRTMIEELKEIRSKLDLARAMLLGVTAILQKLSGLDDRLSGEIAKQLEAVQREGKRIDL